MVTGKTLKNVVLTKGDWLDVMDEDGVWNVARVFRVPSPKEIEVKYDGWPEEYDDVVRVDSGRVAPYYTFTWAVKCWVKYLKWPMWPSLITIRTPGTEEGMRNLTKETRLYVDFMDNSNFAERDRCWQQKRQVKPFNDTYDENRMEKIDEKFEQALELVLRSDAVTKMPTFVKGTLPLQYKYETTETVVRMRKSMGKTLWDKNFENNRIRHCKTHIYEIDTSDCDSAGEESMSLEKLEIRRPNKSAADTQTQHKITEKEKKRRVPAKTYTVSVKTEPKSDEKVENPDKVESVVIDAGRKDEGMDPCMKKRRLYVKSQGVGLQDARNVKLDKETLSSSPRCMKEKSDEGSNFSHCDGVVVRFGHKRGK